MAKLNLNTVDGLTRLMNEMNDIIGKRIYAAKLNEAVADVDKLPFVTCKQIFEGVCDKLYDTKNGKKIIADYANTIKENKDLRQLYTISENVKNPSTSHIDNPNLYVCESVNLVRDLNKKKLQEGIKSIRNIVKMAIKESNISSEEVNALVNEGKELNESINYICSNKKTAGNLLEYTNNLNTVIEHVSNNNPENINESTGTETTFEDLKKVFSNGLELWENQAIEKLVIANMSGSDKKDIFENYKENCISLINETLEDEDIELETKSHLSTMKEQLSKKEFVTESANEDILKLANLEHTLKD